MSREIWVVLLVAEQSNTLYSVILSQLTFLHAWQKYLKQSLQEINTFIGAFVIGHINYWMIGATACKELGWKS